MADTRTPASEPVRSSTSIAPVPRSHFFWSLSTRLPRTLDTILVAVRECATRLHLQNKVDMEALGAPIAEPQSERLVLAASSGSSLDTRVVLTLLADTVIMAEVEVKHAKSAGGLYRGSAQPDVQWKLQQLQDASAFVARAATRILELVGQKDRLLQTIANEDEATGNLAADTALAMLQAIGKDLQSACTALVLPRRRSLLELSQLRITRCFNPPLPHDLLVSFYVSSARLVCALYQVPPKGSSQQLGVSQADIVLDRLGLVLRYLQQASVACADLLRTLQTTREHERRIQKWT